jgi:hypothetical protein
VQSVLRIRKRILAAFVVCLPIVWTEPSDAQDREATVDELHWKNGTSVLANGPSQLVITNANLIVDGSVTANDYFGDLPHAVVVLRSDGTTDQYPFSADTDVARGDALESAWAALTDDSTLLIPGYQGKRYRVDAHWSSIHCTHCPDLDLSLHSTNLSRVAVVGLGMPDITVGDGVTADRGCHVTLNNCYDWLFMNLTFSAYPKPGILSAETLYSTIQPNNEGVAGKGHTYINIRNINYGNHGPGVSSWNWHHTYKLTNNVYRMIYGENGGGLIDGGGTVDGALHFPMKGDTFKDIETLNCYRTIEFGGGDNQTMGNIAIDGVKVTGCIDSAIMMFGSSDGFVDWNDCTIRNVVIDGKIGTGNAIHLQGSGGNRLARWNIDNVRISNCTGRDMMLLNTYRIDGFTVSGYHVFNEFSGQWGVRILEGAGGNTEICIRDSSFRGLLKEALSLKGTNIRVVNVTAIDNSTGGDFSAFRVLSGSINVQFHDCTVVNYLSSGTQNDGLIIDAGAMNTLLNDITYHNIESGGQNWIDNGTGTIIGRWTDTDAGLSGLGDYVRFNGLEAAPSGSEGDMYYDTTTKKFRGHNGTSWVDFH